MESCLGECRGGFAIHYLDDLLVYSGSFEVHLKHVRLVLKRLKKYGIKIKASKCRLFKREISYLGPVISADGYNIDPKNLDAVLGKLKKQPNNITELRCLVGIVGYFRRAILIFGQIAKPLYDILKNSDLISRSKQPINWTEKDQSSLDNLLICVISPPILAVPEFQLPFILHTDALVKGLGCAWHQTQENQLRVLGYDSRALVAAEKNYHSFKLEILAIKWAICEHFRDYLYNSPHCNVYTNFNPMTYLFKSTKVNATV